MSKHELIVHVLQTHVPTATTFCKACPGFRPPEGWREMEDNAWMPAHQADMILAAIDVADLIENGG